MQMHFMKLLKDPERCSRLSRVVLSLALLLPTAFTVSGCASSSIDVVRTSRIPKGESLVFGRVKWANNKLPGGYALVLQRGESGTASVHRLGDDGYFFWHLPRGHYTLIQLRHGILSGSSRRTDQWRACAAFSVPKEEGSVYIGVLSVFIYNRDDGQSTKFRVQDEYESATQALYSRFGSVHGKVRKGIMELEEEK